MASESTGEKKQVVYPNYQGEIDLILHDGGNKKYVWNTVYPLFNLSITMPCD